MQRLSFGELADMQSILRIAGQIGDHEASREFRDQMLDALESKKLTELFDELGYRASAESLSKLRNTLRSDRTTAPAIRALALELEGRITDELHRTALFALTPTEEAWFDNAAPFGQAVSDAFPTCLGDAQEAAKALAFHRNTASVFHCMRVMEVGLRALGGQLHVDVTHKPGWEGILKKAHGQMSLPNDKKDPEWLKDEDFLSDAITMLTAVKTAWRNRTMHVEKSYADDHATRIFQSVAGFMQQLAARLHE